MIHYFAYGSNLDDIQMSVRCRSSTIVSTGYLADYRLAFTYFSSGWSCGVADVVHDNGSEVWGMVYELTLPDLEVLDRYEGYPHAYTRFQATIITAGVPLPRVWTYTVNEKGSFVPPSRNYLDIIRRAAIKYKFPVSYLRQLDRIPIKEEK